VNHSPDAESLEVDLLLAEHTIRRLQGEIMKSMRRAAASIVAVAGILSLTTGTPAQAAPNTALSAPTAICGGAGWTLIDHHDLINQFTEENFGVVTLYYGNGYNCAATTKRVAVGVLTNASAFVCRKNDGACAIKSGDATGRVWTAPLYAPTTCVKWGGGVSDDTIWRVLYQPDPPNWGHGNDC
jgi:hypothetical protein